MKLPRCARRMRLARSKAADIFATACFCSHVVFITAAPLPRPQLDTKNALLWILRVGRWSAGAHVFPARPFATSPCFLLGNLLKPRFPSPFFALISNAFQQFCPLFKLFYFTENASNAVPHCSEMRQAAFPLLMLNWTPVI
jgi:hypothetical protein